jgi:hypothetical protein
MADYLAWDRPSPARYEHGIDAKIVVMGNTGPSSSLTMATPNPNPTPHRRWEDQSPPSVHTEQV